MKTFNYCNYRYLSNLVNKNRWYYILKNNYSFYNLGKNYINDSKKTINYYRNFSTQEEKNNDDYFSSMGDNIEKRYSLALYNVGKKNNKINEITNDLLFIKNGLLKDKTFLNFLHTPNIERKEKLDFLKNECKKFNKFNSITLNFLESLFDSKRMNFLQKIIEEFELLLMREKKEIKCIVYTAREIDNNYKKKIHDSIVFKLKNELKPLIEFKTDKFILGGLILQIGTQVFDFSAKSKIERIRNSLS
ncbi:mitochondrial ATP synthase delta subunit, putative [Plasmodium gallinaceum]|uniref:Mitochondrial ATP synthase delta subunit, putative n=1 Tax=Plasmodium gallinaceum TaxID=5849 RepID=A0A1J1GYC5_PLAGA|nr:mitochondrial ATP synthase delta subunit, putative [Plasmodium gallinaceum]CRG97488.1 mitochondrial ATP synthase delta subunit, putative [Plasmodium gallinaceum]